MMPIVELPPDATTAGTALRAWYEDSIDGFLKADPDAVLGRLATNGSFTLLPTQRDAWLEQIEFLRERIDGLAGSLFFEFSIPRMGRRIDAVLIIGSIVFVLEFKVGAAEFDRSALDQAWDYALDLKNFHEASHHLTIAPIVVATEAVRSPSVVIRIDDDLVYQPIPTDPAKFREVVDLVLAQSQGDPIDARQWSISPYRPTPTIVEAARALYAQHSVESIARHDAGAENLHVTSQHLEEIVAGAEQSRRKVICFVTGVPGAGKTLVGLNVATRRQNVNAETPAVYLSGNGPLVAVLREALTRDEFMRQKSMGAAVRKGKVAESVKAFIQNVHHFRDEAIRDPSPPAEHVAVFDEAQRAWTLRWTELFMRRRKNISGFSQSEPEFLLSCMDRHSDWAVVICLVGGGQEINSGEAGIDAWLEAVYDHFPAWEMHISSRLTDSEYAAGRALETVRGRPDTHLDDRLHLSVSMRSFRAENVSFFVKALLDLEKLRAQDSFEKLSSRFPIAITRDLDIAKEWVRDHARGTERFGLLASRKALRLKPHAIDVRFKVDPVSWFLSDRDDTRSSYYLEDAATEIQVQGLELDWTCVTWDGDLRFTGSKWAYHDFRGKRWCNIRDQDNQRYLLNAYRVLLTRARQGMVIFVPTGDRNDPTRPPENYDATFRYLTSVGIPVLS